MVQHPSFLFLTICTAWAIGWCGLPVGVEAAEGTVKVFILAGQSNMEGKAGNALFNYQAEDPKTADLFRHLREDGEWIVRDDVFIKFLGRKGPLTIGFGSPGATGVELEFGTMMGNHFDEPVLLIKAAWGGHSLFKLFRSPSAGYPSEERLQKELDDAQKRVKANNEKQNRNDRLPTMDEIKMVYGSSYRNMLAEVKETFDSYETLFPALAGRKLEVAGFFWFQGWNDLFGDLDDPASPPNEYASNMKHFIRDVRRDLGAPNLPFVIAASGNNGSTPATGGMLAVREAQMSMNDVPEFQENVRAFRTDVLVDQAAEELFPTWRDNFEQWQKVGSDRPYHYFGSAIWFTRIGRAAGEAMRELLTAAGSAAAPPVNIVLLMTDDMGWRDLRCQGNERLTTPALDRLALQGVRFTDAYSASPVCSPTRGAIITGQSPARLRITQHGKDGPAFWPKDRPVQPPAAEHVLPLETITLANRLKAAGYATGFFGKWHLSGDEDPKDPAAGGPAFWPEHQGFDVNVGGCGLGGPPTYFDPYRIPAIRPRKQGEYLTDRLAAETVSFMTAHRDEPMFVCLWTYNPHYPFEAPEELVARYRGKEGPGLKNPVYGAQIEATDRAIGTVLDAIDRLDLAARTLVLFTSDNGGWEGATDNRPLRSGKGNLYEGGIRVPLIIRWPAVVAPARPVAPGAVDHTPVVSMDLAATILDAANVPLGPGESLDGASLRPLLEGNRLDRAPLFFHYPHYAWHRSNRPGGAIRSGRYKLIRRYDDASVELYDLVDDVGETRNLAAEKPELAAKLDQQLGRWLQETGALMPTPRESQAPDGRTGRHAP